MPQNLTISTRPLGRRGTASRRNGLDQRNGCNAAQANQPKRWSARCNACIERP
jgi:hypothetical protein